MIFLPVYVGRNRIRNRKVSEKKITDSNSKPWIPITLLHECDLLDSVDVVLMTASVSAGWIEAIWVILSVA